MVKPGPVAAQLFVDEEHRLGRLVEQRHQAGDEPSQSLAKRVFPRERAHRHARQSKIVARLARPTPKKKDRGRPSAGFKKSARQLVIYYGQLDGLSDIQRQSLRKELQEIMKKLDARPKTTTLSRRGPVRNTA